MGCLARDGDEGSPGPMVAEVHTGRKFMPDVYRSRNTREAITSRLRLRDHDYREPGPYFVTVCVENRHCLFGAIHDAEISLSPSGRMVHDIWTRIPERFPSVLLGEHVVMPNHLHGILTLTPNDEGCLRAEGPTLSDVVHWFKRQTIRAYSQGVKADQWRPYDGRLWQRGFMDHIVRNDREMDRLHRYIEVNVAQWEDDTFHQASKA
jgi:putative transposase